MCFGGHKLRLPPGGLHRSPPIATIIERIRSYPERDYLLTSLAEEVGMSLSRIKTNFRAQMGIGPQEFILRCKIDAAKKLLLNDRRSATLTAMGLGFSSSQY